MFLLPTPEGGLYIDVQSITVDSVPQKLTQTVWMGQFPRIRGAPATHLFGIGRNLIQKDAKAGTIFAPLGPLRDYDDLRLFAEPKQMPKTMIKSLDREARLCSLPERV